MKRLLIIAATLLFALSCTKNTRKESPLEILFQVANYKSITTRGTTDYKIEHETIPFGAYAWYKGESSEEDAVFMVNQKISYVADENEWKAVECEPYYWPNTGTLDFISYSPYTADGTGAPSPAITETGIVYGPWNVNEHRDVDVMYADKSHGVNQNLETKYYIGVPTLFRHALSKLSFRFRLAYSEVTADTGDKTRWEVSLKEVSLKDIKTTGGLSLELDSDRKWAQTAPANRVWRDNGDKADIALDVSSLTAFTDTEPHQVGQPFLVLPQYLDEGQKINFIITIKTFRDTGSGYTQIFQETDVPLSADLTTTNLIKWSINQYIIYTFILAPSLPIGSGSDLDHDGIEDLMPSVIQFDPAINDWEAVTINTLINL